MCDIVFINPGKENSILLFSIDKCLAVCGEGSIWQSAREQTIWIIRTWLQTDLAERSVILTCIFAIYRYLAHMNKGAANGSASSSNPLDGFVPRKVTFDQIKGALVCLFLCEERARICC